MRELNEGLSVAPPPALFVKCIDPNKHKVGK